MRTFIITSLADGFQVDQGGVSRDYPYNELIIQVNDTDVYTLELFNKRTKTIDYYMYTDKDSIDVNGVTVWPDAVTLEAALDDVIFSSEGGGSGNDPNAIHDNVAGEIEDITEKETLADDDWFLIEDSEDSNNKKKVKSANLPSGGSGSNGIQDSVSFSSQTSVEVVHNWGVIPNVYLIDTNGEVFTPVSINHNTVTNNSFEVTFGYSRSGTIIYTYSGETTNIPVPTPVIPRYLNAELAGSASATLGQLSKTSSEGSTNNPSGKPITSQFSQGLNNGGSIGYLSNGETIDSIGIKISGAAVGTGSVGLEPKILIRFFRQNDSDRTQLGSDVFVTLDPTGIGVFNNASASAFQYAKSEGLGISTNDGDLIGWEFFNQSGSTEGINSVRRLVTTVKLI